MARTFSAATTYLSQSASLIASLEPRPITLAIWARPTARLVSNNSLFNNNFVAGNSYSGDPRLYWQLGYSASNDLLQLYTNGAYVSSSGFVLTAGAWVHLATSWNTTSNAIAHYVNGAAQGTGSAAPGSPWNISGCSIGNLDTGVSSFKFGGDLAEFAAWNAILSAPEIAALAGGIPPEQVRPTALVACLPISGYQSPEGSQRLAASTWTISGSLPRAATQPPVSRLARRYRSAAWTPEFTSGGPSAQALTGVGIAGTALGVGTLATVAALTGVGVVSTTAGTGTLATVAALTGVGVVSTTAGTGTLTAVAALTGVGVIATGPGVGTLDQATPGTISGVGISATVAGTGTLAAVAALTGVGVASTTLGTGTLATVAALSGVGVASTTLGTGTLTTVAALSGVGVIAIGPGVGTLSQTTPGTINGVGISATVAGTGTLATVAALTGAAVVSGAVGTGTLATVAALAGIGVSVGSVGTGTLTTVAALSGVGIAGTTVGTGTLAQATPGALSGVGIAGTTLGIGTLTAVAALAGVGVAVTAAGTGTLAAVAVLSGAGVNVTRLGIGVVDRTGEPPPAVRRFPSTFRIQVAPFQIRAVCQSAIILVDPSRTRVQDL